MGATAHVMMRIIHCLEKDIIRKRSRRCWRVGVTVSDWTGLQRRNNFCTMTDGEVLYMCVLPMCQSFSWKMVIYTSTKKDSTVTGRATIVERPNANCVMVCKVFGDELCPCFVECSRSLHS